MRTTRIRPFRPGMCLTILAATTIAGAWAGCRRAGKSAEDHAHDGGDAHSHGEGGDELDPVTVTLFTDKLELFMEYPPLVQGVPARFLAHFSVLATGEPVRKGSLTLEVTSAAGPPVTKTWDAPKRDGLFVPEWTFDAPGTFRLRLLVDSAQVQDVVDVGEVVVHRDPHEAEHAAEAPVVEPADLVPFLMEQQWKIGMLLGRATRRTLVERLPIPAQVVAPQGASAAVSPPVAGRLLPPPDGRMPRVGEEVKAGEILAMIEPALPMTELAQLSANRAQVQALETELALRELDLDTKALEVERALIQSRAKIEYARRALERVARLREKGIGTEEQHDEAHQSLRLTEAEYEAAQAMRRSYDDARSRLSELRSRAMPSLGPPTTDDNSPRMPLRAPISGEVVSAAHIEGEHLDAAHQEVFRIVNVGHVWVQCNVSEFGLARLSGTPGGTLTLPSYPGRAFDILGHGGRLVHIGKVIDPQTRTVSVIFELPNEDNVLRVGMFAEVHVETQKAAEAVATPEDAIVMDNGRPIAFVLIEGESFQRRELELGVRDAGFVEIISGVDPGERLITRGAHAVKLAAQSPASFGAGHVH